MPDRTTLVTALHGAGWHPAAWRVAGPTATRLSSLRHWRDLVVRMHGLPRGVGVPIAGIITGGVRPWQVGGGQVDGMHVVRGGDGVVGDERA